MMRLDALFDESGIHDGAKLCVIAGFIGTAKQWARFEELWRPSATPPFHAKEFFKSNPLFGCPYEPCDHTEFRAGVDRRFAVLKPWQ